MLFSGAIANNLSGAWFKLIFGCFYAVFSFIMVIIFFRARNVFEIRARYEEPTTVYFWNLQLRQRTSVLWGMRALVPCPNTGMGTP